MHEEIDTQQNTIDLINEIDLEDILRRTGLVMPDITKLKKKSDSFSPPSVNPSITLFFNIVQNKLMSLAITQSQKFNLTVTPIQALKQLDLNKDIIIKPSDKGGNVVVMNVDFNRDLCLAILENPEWYKTISPLLISFNDHYSIIEKENEKDLINKSVF